MILFKEKILQLFGNIKRISRRKTVIKWRKSIKQMTLYLLSFTEAKSLNNWSSVEYNSIRSSCFWVAFPNWYACSITARNQIIERIIRPERLEKNKFGYFTGIHYWISQVQETACQCQLNKTLLSSHFFPSQVPLHLTCSKSMARIKIQACLNKLQKNPRRPNQLSTIS